MSARKRILIIGLGLALITMGIGGMQVSDSMEFLQPYKFIKGALAFYGLLIAILGTGVACIPGIEWINEK